MIPTMYWLGLSQETRKKIATLLEIPRSGHMEVVDGRVASDGYSALDLSVVTLERLQKFLGSDSDNFLKLFDQLVENVELPMMEIKQHEVTTEGKKLTVPEAADLIREKGINLDDLEGDIAIAPELDGKVKVAEKKKPTKLFSRKPKGKK